MKSSYLRLTLLAQHAIKCQMESKPHSYLLEAFVRLNVRMIRTALAS